PRVGTAYVNPGKFVTPDELETAGLLAPPEWVMPRVEAGPARQPRGWPSYRRCLENAPPTRGGDRRDVSKADFTFCLIAIDWGWDTEEAADRLMQESRKAQENGQAYALRTAQAAAQAVERRGYARRAR